jgi:hypothetical protein
MIEPFKRTEDDHGNQRHDTTREATWEHRPWDKGKLIGQKPPLQPKHVWAIRSRLQLANKKRDLALFNVAIDSKLRGCDVVSLRSTTHWRSQSRSTSEIGGEAAAPRSVPMGSIAPLSDSCTAAIWITVRLPRTIVRSHSDPVWRIS